MRCLGCQRLSFSIVCSECHDRLFAPEISTRTAGSLDVITLYAYSSIEPFILTKHDPLGYRVYRYFARKQIRPFLRRFAEGRKDPIYLVAVDDRVDSGYAHTAVLSRYAAVENIRPLTGVLHARNRVRYAGKPLSYRLENPRDFRYRGPSGIRAILLDDVVTTGLTLQEAYTELLGHGVEVLFALTLADARR